MAGNEGRATLNLKRCSLRLVNILRSAREDDDDDDDDDDGGGGGGGGVMLKHGWCRLPRWRSSRCCVLRGGTETCTQCAHARSVITYNGASE